MKISIKESIMVYPIQETPTQNLWLSNLDLVQNRVHVPSAYFYKPNGSTNNFFDTKLLIVALRKVLVPFYPAAGRLGIDENGRVELKCGKDGVLFTEAEADSAMDDEIGHFMNGLYDVFGLLLPKVDYSKGLSSFPLLLVQITRFNCGGVCLGVGFHHTLVDGHSAIHFTKSWSNIVRGISAPIPLPFVDRTILRCRNPPTPTFPHSNFHPENQKNTSESTNTTFEILKITPHQLDILKHNTKTKETETKYSTYELLSAHIWRCACKARGLDDNEETKLHVTVNGRSRLNPPVPEGYFGNVVFFIAPKALSGEIVSEPFMDTVARVNGAIKRMDNEYLRSSIDYLEQVDDITEAYPGPKACACPNLRIVSWIRMPFGEVHDFGWGRPTSMIAGNRMEGKAHILESADDDGSLLVPMTLKTDHFQEFKKLFFKTWPLVDEATTFFA